MKWRASILIYVGSSFLLTACDHSDLPQYWLCKGSSHQEVEDLERGRQAYSGSDPMLLEIYKGDMNQFLSPAFFGKFIQCENIGDLLIFRANDCKEYVGQENFREGILNKKSGNFNFKDVRINLKLRVVGDGQYSCKFLGTSYTFTPFNHAAKME